MRDGVQLDTDVAGSGVVGCVDRLVAMLVKPPAAAASKL
jgi:hypothetical protein